MANQLTVASERHLELDVNRPSGTVRYRPDRHGRITPTSRADEAVLRAGGASVANPAVAFTGSARRCQACGFASFFVTCGRCGGRCERES